MESRFFALAMILWEVPNNWNQMVQVQQLKRVLDLGNHQHCQRVDHHSPDRAG
jgi:hypothetical protein